MRSGREGRRISQHVDDSRLWFLGGWSLLLLLVLQLSNLGL